MEEIRLQIKLIDAPPGVLFGIQEGSGSKYKTVQQQRSGENMLVFDISIHIRDKKPADSEPDFTGPMVQGARGERFLYIDIGTYAGDLFSQWARRLKVPLRGISWDTIKLLQKQAALLELIIPGTGKDDGPTCGSVKPFNGWKVVR